MYKSVMMTALSWAHELGWLFDLGRGPLGIVYSPPPPPPTNIREYVQVKLLMFSTAARLCICMHYTTDTKGQSLWLHGFQFSLMVYKTTALRALTPFHLKCFESQ